MTTYSFDMLFTYINTRWEGLVVDSRVLTETMRDPENRFLVPPNPKYYVVDSGYNNTQGFLAPFHGQMYHIQQFRNSGQPTGPQELFNYFYSSLCNCIEMCFGVLKARFKILKCMINYWMPRQSLIPIACCVIHNLIKMHARDDHLFDNMMSICPYKILRENKKANKDNNKGFAEERPPRSLAPTPMSPLSSDQVLKDNNTRDPSAIEALNLTHRALSDVSFLCDFKNLARLDLRLNKLTSLEGLKLCANLKWLSVAENKLESLKGIEALSKLTVFNAGKNKLKSMEEVRSITSLCALILNDNEISSICGLDKMKHLNTLVLSRNPIGEIGDSLLKLKSITKLSLSYCQLQNIGTSLKSCVELKELRLAHNDIKSLPAELVHNKDLQNLDLGYNVITRWLDLKVLDSFANLRSLNLQGNPIAANEKLVKKIRNTLPDLCVFNSKPIEKYAKNEKGDKIVNDSSLGDKNLEIQTEHKRDRIKKKDPIDLVMDQEMDANLNSVSDFDTKKKSKGKKLGSSDNALEVLTHEDEKGDKVKKKKSKHHLPNPSKIDKLENDPVSEKQPKQKSEVKNEKLQKRKGSFKDKNDADAKKKAKKISTVKGSEPDVIDESEALFAELLAANNTERPKYEEEKVIGNASQAMKSASGVVALSGKRKKAKSQGSGSVPELPPVVEVGLGGTSTWGDE